MTLTAMPWVFCRVVSARLRISLATTEKPLPASPAWAASIAAFMARRLVWDAIFPITAISSRIAWAEFAISSMETEVWAMRAMLEDDTSLREATVPSLLCERSSRRLIA